MFGRTVWSLAIIWIYLFEREPFIITKKYAHAFCLKTGDIFFTFLTMLLLEAKAGICFVAKENLLLYCY